MSLLDVDYIKAHANCGAEVGACAREAAALAIERNEVVIFTHNEMNYRVDPKDLIRGILNRQNPSPQTATEEAPLPLEKCAKDGCHESAAAGCAGFCEKHDPPF